MSSTQLYYVIGLFAAEDTEAQSNIAKEKQRWVLNLGCLGLKPMHLTIMWTFGGKDGKILAELGHVGHSNYVPGFRQLQCSLEGRISFLGLP